MLLPLVPRASSGWYLVIPLLIAGSGLGLLVSQLNNYTLSPISEERVSEAAGVNSAGGSFGLSFGLAFGGAILLATLSIAFTNMADASKVLSPTQQQQVADALEDDTQVVSNTQLEQQLAGQPKDVRAEIISINTDARHIALQVALVVPILAGLLGLSQLIPDDAPARPQAIDRRRRRGPRLSASTRGWWEIRVLPITAIGYVPADAASSPIRRSSVASCAGSTMSSAMSAQPSSLWGDASAAPRAGRSA